MRPICGTVALCVVLSCGQRVTPLTPWVRAHPVGEPNRELPTELEVGYAFAIEGGFDAECEHEIGAWDQDPSNATKERYDCGKSADVTVECHGPCTVDGTKVTPTDAGEITVVVHLHKGKNDHGETRKYVVRPPTSFSFSGCTTLPPIDDHPACKTVSGSFAIFTGQTQPRFEEPVTVKALANGREVTGPGIDLGALIGTPLAPGNYELEARHGALVRQFIVVYAPSSP